MHCHRRVARGRCRRCYSDKGLGCRRCRNDIFCSHCNRYGKHHTVNHSGPKPAPVVGGCVVCNSPSHPAHACAHDRARHVEGATLTQTGGVTASRMPRALEIGKWGTECFCGVSGHSAVRCNMGPVRGFCQRCCQPAEGPCTQCADYSFCPACNRYVDRADESHEEIHPRLSSSSNPTCNRCWSGTHLEAFCRKDEQSRPRTTEAGGPTAEAPAADEPALPASAPPRVLQGERIHVREPRTVTTTGEAGRVTVSVPEEEPTATGYFETQEQAMAQATARTAAAEGSRARPALDAPAGDHQEYDPVIPGEGVPEYDPEDPGVAAFAAQRLAAAQARAHSEGEPTSPDPDLRSAPTRGRTAPERGPTGAQVQGPAVGPQTLQRAGTQPLEPRERHGSGQWGGARPAAHRPAVQPLAPWAHPYQPTFAVPGSGQGGGAALPPQQMHQWPAPTLPVWDPRPQAAGPLGHGAGGVLSPPQMYQQPAATPPTWGLQPQTAGPPGHGAQAPPPPQRYQQPTVTPPPVAPQLQAPRPLDHDTGTWALPPQGAGTAPLHRVLYDEQGVGWLVTSSGTAHRIVDRPGQRTESAPAQAVAAPTPQGPAAGALGGPGERPSAGQPARTSRTGCA